MSGYTAKDFKVGEPIDSDVSAQVQLLQKVFGSKSNDSNRHTYTEIQGATPWIKMQSGVKLDSKVADEYGTKAGDFLAKSYVLFGQNHRVVKTEDKNTTLTYSPDIPGNILPGYRVTEDLGIRPRPGITGMSISSHNRFGSLRTATVSFQCWSKDDMDNIELLYMRPGMTVLLEWGHSKFIDENGVYDTPLGIDYFTSEDRIAAITSKIQKHRKKVNYSYDGIVGIIKNFSWKFRQDGGYDCQVSLVTAGDLIESYKANFLLSQKQVQLEYTQAVNTYLSGSNSTINPIFPSTQYDDDTPYASVRDVPPVQQLYQSFCAATETALELLPDIIQENFDRLPDAAAKRQFLWDPFYIDPEDDDDLVEMQQHLDVLKAYVGSLRLAKPGLRVATIERFVKVKYEYYSWSYFAYGFPSVTSDSTPTQPIEIDSEWQEGIVDLNYGNNDLISGSIDAGYVALVMPDYAEKTAEFAKYVNTLADSDIFTGYSSDLMKVILEFLGKLEVQQGSNFIKLFTFDPDWATDKVNGYYTDSFERLEFLGHRPSANTGYAQNAWFGILSTEGVHEYGNFPIEESEYKQARRNLNNPHSFTYYGEPYYFPTNTVPWLGQDDDNRNLWNNVDQNLPRSIHFGRIIFTGYEYIKNSGISGGTIAAVNANFDPTGERVIVPNDTYLSKLHLYLRSRLYNPYSVAHLKYNFIGKTFLEVFKYREVYPTNGGVAPDVIRDLFGPSTIELSGATTRIDNLKRYNGSGLNTYEKQLKSWNLLLGGRFIPHSGDPGYNVIYIKLGALLELLNRHVLKSDSSYFFLFNTMYKNAKSTHLYRTMDDHISSNPEICILPHQVKALQIEGRNGVSYLVDRDAPIILNIELSIDFVLRTLSKYIDDRGQVTTLTFIQEILDEISRVTGGINSLQLQYREDSGIFHVVDRNQVTPKGRVDYEDTKLNVFGLNSIIKNINMVSKITPKLTSMIAISAQDSAFTSTQDSTGFGALNRGVTDRLFGERYDEDKKIKQDASAKDYDTLRRALLEDLVGLKTYLADYYFGITIPGVGKDTQPGIYQNYCNFLFGADSAYRRGGRPSYNFIIPFQVELELYGISGIQVMDAFILSKEVLPKTYGGRKNSPVAFLVTGVEHKIGQNGWSTLLKTQIFNIDENSPSRDYPLVDDVILSDLDDYYSALPSVTITPYDDLTASQKSTVHYLYKTCIDYGLSDMQARAVLGVCSKECNFIPKMEDSYGTTSFERLREIWSRFNQSPYASIPGTKLVKNHWPNEADFWDVIYQGHNGNNAPGDAFKYRGAGLNQITGKDNYTNVQDLYVAAGSPVGTIDILSDPSSLNRPAGDGVYKIASHIAALWFKNSRNLSNTGTQDQITQNIFRINAGFGTSLTNPSTAQGLAKTKKFVASLPATIPAP